MAVTLPDPVMVKLDVTNPTRVAQLVHDAGAG
jgi:hypothetical protein